VRLPLHQKRVTVFVNRLMNPRIEKALVAVAAALLVLHPLFIKLTRGYLYPSSLVTEDGLVDSRAYLIVMILAGLAGYLGGTPVASGVKKGSVWTWGKLSGLVKKLKGKKTVDAVAAAASDPGVGDAPDYGDDVDAAPVSADGKKLAPLKSAVVSAASGNKPKAATFEKKSSKEEDSEKKVADTKSGGFLTMGDGDGALRVNRKRNALTSAQDGRLTSLTRTLLQPRPSASRQSTGASTTDAASRQA